MVVQNQSKMGEDSKPRKPKRKDTQVPQPSGLTEHVADEAVQKERGDSLVRDATTASSLEAEHDSGEGINVNDVDKNKKLLLKIVNLTIDEVTLAQALAALKSPTKKKVQNMLDEEIALKLQVEIDEEEIIARAKEEKIDEANIAWDDIQAKVNVDYQLAQRLQAKEQKQFTIKEKATLFKELLDQRRKHFAAKRAKEKRNKPPTKTQ
ncbi:hypothetical protein Tco_1210690 [Tanacetum coccineum]